MTEMLQHDLSRMDDVSIEGIQRCLKARYDQNLIYTYISDILIAVNPCKKLNIYDDETHDKYKPDKGRSDLPPHIFQVAAQAYRRMVENVTNQVIIVSGESGAGKTESTKHMVKHLVHICQKGDMVLHEKVVRINPLLEAFGNAKTVMNDNSSRYAKYLEINFKDGGEILGAEVRDFMLEKSRVVHQTNGERNFHIFYAIFAGCTKEVLADYFLNKDQSMYRIMKSDQLNPADTDKYKKMYFDTMDILQNIKMDKEVLLRMLAVVILISEIEFEEDDRGAAQIKDVAPFAHATLLLDLDEFTFGEALIASKCKIKDKYVATQKTLKQASAGRDALAKILYERMFGWLVQMINEDIHPKRQRSNIAASIGILDIAGFEKLQNNSFEQMCINLVNEKLQSFMNRKIFTMELEIYQSEGIHLDGIHFENNDVLLAMFETPKTGILAILDENSKLQLATDKGFVDHLKKNFGDHKLFSQPRGDHPVFCIQHFADLVSYNADGFLEKNRDMLNEELLDTMRKSKDDFIMDLFTIKKGLTGTISTTRNFHFRASRRGVSVMPAGKTILKPTSRGAILAEELRKSLKKKFGTVKPAQEVAQITPERKQATLVSFFKESLMELLNKLGDGDPFFVRCIKANSYLRANGFDEAVVANQLKYNGLAEIAKIRKMGFAVRKQFKEFFLRYRWLFPSLPSQRQADVNERLLRLVPSSFHKDFRCGTSMIFMTSELNNWFERILRCRQRTAAQTVTKCLRKVAEIKVEKKRKEAEKLKEDGIIREKERLEQEQKPTSPKRIHSGMRGTGKHDGLKAQKEVSFRSPSPTSEDDNATPSCSTDVSSSSMVSSSFQKDGDDIDKDSFEQSPLSDSHIQKKEDKTGQIPFWDVCQVIARERKVRDVDEDRGLQVIKVLTYVILFCTLLWCAVAQKLSLMVLVAPQINRTDDVKEDDVETYSRVAAAKHILLTVAILIPYCLTFLSSVFKWMFDNLQFPSLSTFILNVIVEVLHSLGICIMAFIVLPEIDIVRGIFLLNGVAIVPAVLFPVCASDVKQKSKINNRNNRSQHETSVKIPDANNTETDSQHNGGKHDKSTRDKRTVIALNILTCLLQVFYMPFVLLRNHFAEDSKMDNETDNIVYFIISIIFVSFAYWENFVDDRFCGETNSRGYWRKIILKTKFELQQARPIITTCTSFIKICLTFLLSWLIKSYYEENTDGKNQHKPIAAVTFTEAFHELEKLPTAYNGAIITLTLSAFVGHYVGYTACKLKLQRFSYNVPLLLSTPLAVAIAAVDCSGIGLLRPFTKEEALCRPNEEVRDRIFHYAVGFAVWVSLYWLCRHIFHPNIERLAKTERLYMNPFYCGILFEQHLLLNRRRHTRKVRLIHEKDKTYYRLSEYNSRVNIEGDEEDDKDEGSKEDEDIYESKYRNPKFRDVPMIYACATMWHETKYEMLQLMKSIFRMDRDQSIRQTAEKVFEKEDEDFYDFEAHIMFDDAMMLNDDEEYVPNDFVKLLVSIVDEAASCVHEKPMQIRAPFKVPTPYGGQLIITMPGDNFLFIHLKDKQNIRHRKRWSQVMYMYYLLSFRIVRMCQESVTAALNGDKINSLISWENESPSSDMSVGRSSIFKAFDDQVLKKAQNTYLLALDGDVDFSPGAVRLLLDRMRKSEKVGAACGRIHPIGTGPVVWFQKFEYAIAHWLQKATEHVLGCVLCSPGCFSMFRGSALMDDNVMKKYTILPTEAAHHLMYDQGEDRWLCTLLLQQGYRVDYAAGSDAFTYAPERFAEFFNQRRRWMPSTVFNIIDLLADYKNTVYVNSNISMLYIIYQGALLLSTIVGPATVLMMIAGANMVVFKVTVIWGYLIALAPAIFFFILCFYAKAETQVKVAEILTALYAFVMMIVLVGTIVTAASESIFHPSVVFLGFLVVAFTFSALLHPKEWSCIIFGALYFLLIPTGFLLLNIYSLTNLNNVSWGTREVPKKKTKDEIEKEKKEAEEKEKKKKETGFFSRFFPAFQTKDFKDMINKLTENQNSKKEDLSFSETNKLLKELNDNLKEIIDQKYKRQVQKTVINEDDTFSHDAPKDETDKKEPTTVKRKSIPKHSTTEQHTRIHSDIEATIDNKEKKKRIYLSNPAWAECKELGNGKTVELATEELTFWKTFIPKYLQPLDLSEDQKKNTAKALIDLRNNIALGMAMINLLWIAINFMFQFESPTTISLKFSGSSNDPDSPDYLEENQEDNDTDKAADNIIEVDVLGMLFIFFYLAILLLQFTGMIIHRWGTLQHLVSITKLKNPLAKQMTEDSQGQRRDASDKKVNDPKEARQLLEIISNVPLPDYSDDSEDDNSENEKEKELDNLQKTGSRSRPLISESDGIDKQFDGVRSRGTMGRQLNKRLKYAVKSVHAKDTPNRWQKPKLSQSDETVV